LDSTTYPDFRSDKQGHLVLDELTNDGLERLIALNDRDAAQAKVGELSKHLPPVARREAEDVYFRYQQYAVALGQAFTPGEHPPGDDAALQQLDALHALRIEHFGTDTAKALFASDEETARQLILLMRSQAAPDIGHAQQVELAQQTYDRMRAAARPPR
jgi:lipase chaperone LimK